jgi:GTP-binding protein LepA
MPDAATIDHIEEPRIKATILVPDEYLGDVLKLCQDRRGEQLRPHLCGLPRDGGL